MNDDVQTVKAEGNVTGTKLATTFNCLVLTKLVAKKTGKGQPGKGTDVPYPPSLPLSLLSYSYAPCHFYVDWKEWLRNVTKRKSEDKALSKIEFYISERAKRRLPVQFHALGSPRRCPRRYPLILETAEETLFMTRNRYANIKPKHLLSAVSKELRMAFRAPSGFQLWDYDMPRAHLSIFANLSGDERMLQWLKGDPHQETGDWLLSYKVKDKIQRRKLGKTINSAIVAGGKGPMLQLALKDNGINIQPTEAKHYVDRWWSAFPNAHAFRLSHDEMIDGLVVKQHGYTVRFGDRTMFSFDADILAGRYTPGSWRNRCHSRQDCVVKAKRSAFTALLRAWEAHLLDHVVVKARQIGLRLVCPMYDGALFLVPEGLKIEE
jgi:hypothetical protein